MDNHVGPRTASRITREHIEHKQRQAESNLQKWEETPETMVSNPRINEAYWQGQFDALSSLLDV